MTDKFSQIVAAYGPKLAAEFGLTPEQNAGVWGSLGHESGGMIHLQELGKSPPRGGRGFAQWTGARRKSFEGWCRAHKLSADSTDANYGYLIFELHGAYRSTITALKRCTSLSAAVTSFERTYEAAGVKAMASRLSWGRKALAILHPGHPAAVAPAPKKSAAPMAKKAKPKAAAVRKHAAPVHHVVKHAVKR